MKFSELWLREWINPPVDTSSLINKMTMSGLKVDTVQSVAYFFNGVVIGNIVDIKTHPKNCNLQINTIDIGNRDYFNVISSKKYKKHLRVAVAPIGAKLPGNTIVQCIEIDGEFSEGILCSFSVLGIDYSEINDIIELPENSPLGVDLRKYLKLDDNIINVSITPNRGDCLNIMGISRDIAAMYRLSITVPKVNCVIPEIKDVLPISIDVPDSCPCHFSRIIKNINIAVSTPLWMKEKLRRCGIQPSHVVMDIINYVLLELGQPIYAFDLDSINGGINIRWAQQGEKFYFSHDNKNEIILTSDTLVITDQLHIIGIAGLVIGNTFMINTLKTSNIFLESAFFNPACIMKSSKQYGFVNHSSYRYERQGINPNISQLALERVTYFLIDICGGVSGKIISIIYPDFLPKPTIVILHRLKLNNLLGYIIEDHEIMNILIYLGCKVKYKKNCNLWNVLVPIWRFDIKIEEDLIEEIIRLYGYDNLPGTSIYSKLNIVKKSKNKFSLSQSKILLLSLGYQEVITYSFVDPKIQRLLYPKNKSIILLNPLTLDMSVMRISLCIGLLKTLLYNQNRQHKNIRLFECGECFVPDTNNIDKIHQHLMLSGVMTGSRFDEHWNVSSSTNMLDFYDIKGTVESLFAFHGTLDNIVFKTQIYPGLHPGQSSAIFLKEEYIGFIGVIHPLIGKKLNLKNNTFVFELLWEKISQQKIVSKITDVPKFPINRRDISIVVSEHIPYEEILFECKKNIKDKLIDIKIFDIYRGKEILSGFKSLSIGLYIYHHAYTLQEDEIELIVVKCIEVLKNKFQATLRK